MTLRECVRNRLGKMNTGRGLENNLRESKFGLCLEHSMKFLQADKS